MRATSIEGGRFEEREEGGGDGDDTIVVDSYLNGRETRKRWGEWGEERRGGGVGGQRGDRHEGDVEEADVNVVCINTLSSGGRMCANGQYVRRLNAWHETCVTTANARRHQVTGYTRVQHAAHPRHPPTGRAVKCLPKHARKHAGMQARKHVPTP